jgi:tetratricopeptide (TPR) repeat protein
MRTNQLREALASMREAALLASQAGALHLRARTLSNLSFICHALGMIEETTSALREAHDIFEEIDDVISRCHVLRMLAWNAVDDQRPAIARAAIHEMITIGQHQMIGWVSGLAYMLRGHLAFEEQRIADALTDYEHALVHLQGGDHLAINVGVTLYISLALEQDNQLSEARARFDDAFGRIDGLRAPWARAYLRCNRAVWALRDLDRTTAERQLTLAREELANSDGQLHKGMIQLYMCVMDTLEWEQAQRAGKTRLERQHLKQLLERLGSFMSTARPMLGRSLELRLALRHIQRRLPSWLRARLELELEDPGCRALLLDAEVPAYRGPGQDTWVDMSKRPTPMRLLLALTKHHTDNPGEPMSADALCEQVWPGERILPDAAANRLYVTIAGLRKEGLRETIHNIEGGYILTQNLHLLHTRPG